MKTTTEQLLDLADKKYYMNNESRNLEQEHFASIGEGLYFAALEKAAAESGLTPDQYIDQCNNADVSPLPVTMDEIDF